MSIELAHVPRVPAVRQHNRFVSVRPFHRMRYRVHAGRRIRFMHRSEYDDDGEIFYNFDSRQPHEKKKTITFVNFIKFYYVGARRGSRRTTSFVLIEIGA